MTGEVQQQINKFLFHLSQQDYAQAHAALEKTQQIKIDKIYEEEYAKAEAALKTK